MIKRFNKKIELYFFVYILSLFGSWIRFVITPLYVYHITGSTISSGISIVLTNISNFIIMPLISPFIDRFNKCKMIAFFSFIQGMLIILYSFSKNIYSIYFIIIGLSISSSINRAGNISILKQMVSKDDYKILNSYLVTCVNIFVFIGPIIGGFFSDRLGYSVCFYIDAFTFFLFSVVIYFIGDRKSPNKPITNTIFLQMFINKYLNLFRYITNNKNIIYYILSCFFLWIGVGSVLVLYPIMCIKLMPSMNTAYGTLWSVIGLGQLIGGILVLKLKHLDTFILYYSSILISGIFHTFMFSSFNFTFALLLVGFATIGDGISTVLDDCIVQESVQQESVFIFTTGLDSFIALSTLIGSSITVALISKLTYNTIGIFASAAILISGFIGFIFTRRAKLLEMRGLIK